MAGQPPVQIHNVLGQWSRNTPTHELSIVDRQSFHIACRSDLTAEEQSLAAQYANVAATTTSSNVAPPPEVEIGAAEREPLHQDYEQYQRFSLHAASNCDTTYSVASTPKTEIKTVVELSRLPSRVEQGSTALKTAPVASSDTAIDAKGMKSAAAAQSAVQVQTKHEIATRAGALKKRVTFTSLPRELRDHVYSFVESVGVNVADTRQQWADHPLSTVSHEIALEWRDYYLSNTTFTLDTRGASDFQREKTDIEAHRVMRPLYDWLEYWSDEEVGRLRTLKLYGYHDIVRIEISVRPLAVTVTCQPKLGQQVDDKWIGGVAKLQRLVGGFPLLGGPKDRFTAAYIRQICRLVVDVREMYHHPREAAW
ncbi:hypothetical protein LTR27_008282 [Elasticomyces elasticus]|nr:hypothetical protein LTR27_008282 [Elasticomyces elasticus]